MDIVEFAEKFMDVELRDWQKRQLRLLDEMRKDARICVIYHPFCGRHQAYIYMKNAKELISNGTTNDC